LFTPTDEGHWGLDRVGPYHLGGGGKATTVKWIRSFAAGAYRTLWSMANEFDFTKAKTDDADWERSQGRERGPTRTGICARSTTARRMFKHTDPGL